MADLTPIREVACKTERQMARNQHVDRNR